MNQLVKQFNEEGFLILKEFLSTEDIQNIFDQVEAVFDQCMKNLGLKLENFKNVGEKYLYLKKHHPIMKSHCYDVLGRLDSVSYYMSSPRLTDLARAIYEMPLLLDGLQIRIDDPSNDRFLPLHQEVNQISFLNVGCWIPLVDIPEIMGGLSIVPGSHKQGFLKQVYYPELNNYHGLEPEVIASVKPMRVDIARGDALVFHPFLFHGPLPNRSQEIRWTMVGRYNELKSALYLADEKADLAIPVEKYEPHCID